MLKLNIPMVCSGCGTNQHLSQSHIIPRSRRSDLAKVKENITWHCLSIGEIKGCHQKHESMEIVFLDDFEKSMKYIYKVDQEYFWLRTQKLMEHYKNNMKVLRRIKKAMEV